MMAPKYQMMYAIVTFGFMLCLAFASDTNCSAELRKADNRGTVRCLFPPGHNRSNVQQVQVNCYPPDNNGQAEDLCYWNSNTGSEDFENKRLKFSFIGNKLTILNIDFTRCPSNARIACIELPTKPYYVCNIYLNGTGKRTHASLWLILSFGVLTTVLMVYME